MRQFVEKGEIIDRIPFGLRILTTNIGMDSTEFVCDFGVR